MSQKLIVTEIMPNKMDNIFDIYSEKVDNDKVTEWDSNLLLPD